jgi:ATP-dependent helicase/nuclease subunit B
MIAETLSPLALLACLKHPLAVGELAPGEFRSRVRLLERAVLRGPAPAPGFQGLLDGLHCSTIEDDRKTVLRDWLTALRILAAPFAQALTEGSDPAETLRCHTAFAEALATSQGGAPGDLLWKGDAGQALADFLTDALAGLAGFPPVAAAGYGPLLDSLMASPVVRSPIGQHPRLSILGTMEARLQQADLVILGGLNEGTWPESTPPDPFLSRPMREDIGLPVPEFRIGLSAHDFITGLAAPEVVLTRALRVKGVPTVASRWLLRLEAVLRAAKTGLPLRPDFAGMMRRLDTPEGPVTPAGRPAPRPPLAVRPRHMSVSDVQAWIEDPYRLYARRILCLRELDPLGAEPGAADRGTIIHALLEWFVTEYPRDLPADALETLEKKGRQAFDAAKLPPALETFWWPRFLRIAAWVADQERTRRAEGIFPAAVEVKGRLDFPAPGGIFTLTATADRIDRHPGGWLEIIDYKTGAVPSARAVIAGEKPQLPLEAAIAEAGGFAGLDAAEVPRVSYWKLSGTAEAGKAQSFEGRPKDILDLLKRRVAAFDDPATPYTANPPGAAGERHGYHRAYEQLARLREWSGEADDDDDD